MSQAAFLRSLDADIMAAFGAAGMADTGTYTPPAGAAVAVDVYIDRTANFLLQDDADIVGNRIVVTLQLAQVPAPVRGASVVVGSETFRLDEVVQHDESIERWVVQK